MYTWDYIINKQISLYNFTVAMFSTVQYSRKNWFNPRKTVPDLVRPLSSLCFWTGLHIQLILGSRLMALWWVSIMMH